MSKNASQDAYEEMLDKALHDRGMARAQYVASLEEENTELRKMLMKAKVYLPQELRRELEDLFFDKNTPA